ncbi:MAG: nucleotide exchange factor GrpE [Gammaproteobacteria bacterium]
MTEESAKQGLDGEEPEILAQEAAEELEKLQAEVDEHRDRYVRLAAEMDNLRKRSARETDQARQFGIERFAGELLSVVDSLEMGVAAGAESTAEALLEGSEATLRLLLGAMDKHGVQVVDPDGEPFDPQFHEAIATQPSDTAEPGSVLIVVQKGYSLNGRLLRPARVIVAAAQDG